MTALQWQSRQAWGWHILIRRPDYQSREPGYNNLLAAVSKFGQFRLPHVASVHSNINDYLAIFSARYVTGQRGNSDLLIDVSISCKQQIHGPHPILAGCVSYISG